MNNAIRVVGGSLRGRKLNFSQSTGLRPTSNRVRETLFNWLMHDIHGASCLDAFSGSGALGIEAISRGAQRVLFLEEKPKIVRNLQKIMSNFDLDERAAVRQASAIKYLKGQPKAPFDIVFCDPPFGRGLLLKSLDLLITQGWVSSESLVYAECEDDPAILSEFQYEFEVLKQKRTDQVVYSLLRPKLPTQA